MEHLADYTIVECRFETGRTHQIRIHLAERGHMLCGEKTYTHPLGGKAIEDTSSAPRRALHAAELAFHPSHDRPATAVSDAAAEGPAQSGWWNCGQAGMPNEQIPMTNEPFGIGHWDFVIGHSIATGPIRHWPLRP